jgi:hypothetical protein
MPVSNYPKVSIMMLVSAKQQQLIHLPKRLADDATTTAAAGLQSGLHGAMLQSLQNQTSRKPPMRPPGPGFGHADRHPASGRRHAHQR